MPQALQNRPQLNPMHDRLFEAFGLLHGSRTAGPAGPNPITMSEIDSFLNRFPEDTKEAEQDLIRLIRRVDAAVLGKLYEKLKPSA